MENFKEDVEFQCHFFELLATKCNDDLLVLQRLGAIYSTLGRTEDSLRTDIRASFVAPENPTVHYNLACSFALTGQPQFAISHLRLAVQLGFDDLEQIRTDGDLLPLRNLPDFQRIVEELQQNRQ
ncbi:MAG: hypothetical protein LBC42_02650 [Puniceicoccales bacterium]|jgi:Flp pilus assembly protein TadD|nr:hypothetical protein [Puniceicoccales bacterium]